MGLIGKIALIGIVSIAVLIAVIWDVQNEGKRENGKTTSADEIKNNLPENITTQETPNPETQQEETPAATEQAGQSPDTPQASIPEQAADTQGTPVEIPEQPAVEPGPEMPVSPGVTEKYVIQKNDTLSRIAAKFYGDSKLWPTIAAANTEVIPDPEILKVGTEIVIPPKEEVLVETPGPKMPPAMETYIIQKGDTLTSISRMHYGGDNSRTELIYQANKDKIINKNILRPGTVIVIPPLPAKDDE